MRPWTYPQILRLRDLLAEGKSFRRCARIMGRSLGSIAGAVRFHLREIPSRTATPR